MYTVCNGHGSHDITDMTSPCWFLETEATWSPGENVGCKFQQTAVQVSDSEDINS